MNDSMISAAVSMRSFQQRIDLIADNIANLNTDGYKRKNATFQDILTDRIQQEASLQLPGRRTPLGLTEGWGARLGQVSVDFTQGALAETGQELDLALQGPALYELAAPVLDENGEWMIDGDGNPLFQSVWTRHGSFRLAPVPGADDGSNYLTAQDGKFVLNAAGERIVIPEHARIGVDENGVLTAYDENGNPLARHQLRIMRIMRPDALASIGNLQYVLPDGVNEADVMQLWTGAADDGIAGGRAAIAVHQGHVEKSNVDLTVELTELIGLQRAYQLSARALSSADTMMNLANNLRG